MTRFKSIRLFAALAIMFALCSDAFAQKQNVLTAKPLTLTLKPTLKPVQSGPTKVPVITWGADVKTIIAAGAPYKNDKGETALYLPNMFKEEGLDVVLVNEDDFVKQAQDCLDGKSPYLRGTIDMVNFATPLFRAAGTDLEVIYKLSYSAGGDRMVGRSSIKNLKDLEGKTIALQFPGPHLYYAIKLLRDATVDPKKVKFRFYRDLSVPKETSKEINDPVTAFVSDSTIDAVMCISPDADALTAKEGDLAVKGARPLISTKEASTIIADVYAVRKDYLTANRAKVQSFVHALMRGDEALHDLLEDKSGGAKLQQVYGSAAGILMGGTLSTADIAGMVADCELTDFVGNVSFFRGEGTGRTFEKLSEETQSALIDLGALSAKHTLSATDWDYVALSKNLKNADASKLPEKPKFDTAKIAAKIENALAIDAEAATNEFLFKKEIYFAANEKNFSSDKYIEDYDLALERIDTYRGAPITIEGYVEPSLFKECKRSVAKCREVAVKVLRLPADAVKEKSDQEIQKLVVQTLEQSAKNLSLDRAKAVEKAIRAHAEKKGIKIEEGRFVPIGVGYAAPAYSDPRTPEETAKNRRVVFKVIEALTEGIE